MALLDCLLGRGEIQWGYYGRSNGSALTGAHDAILAL